MRRMTAVIRPVALIVLDGFGLAEPGPGNAVALAATPNFDRLWAAGPRTSLAASGGDVGLPAGQIGNSEVGHLNIGAGRVVMQSLTYVDSRIENGEFFANTVLQDALNVPRGNTVHLVGLVSHGGVHSAFGHLTALLEMADLQGAARVAVHVITDGRDSAPDSGLPCVLSLQAAMEHMVVDNVIGSVTGRYWAMDRDNRWERTRVAHDAIVCGAAEHTASSAANAVQDAYMRGETDEFIAPTVMTDAAGHAVAPIRDGDSVILFNFRADRMRQLLRSLVEAESFDRFERCAAPRVRITTFMQYDASLPVPHAFELPSLARPLAEVVSDAGLAQFHAAETEKYAHVTYFFNAQREDPYPGEERRLVPSPRVATYDLKPEMSAPELTAAVLERLRQADDAFILVNFANPDMVGHTGVLAAAVRACEASDESMGRIVAAVLAKGGAAIIIADHGNAEQMLAADGLSPHTAHTVNRVPCIVAGAGPLVLRDGGRLADVAPTVLELLGLPQPPEMTGVSLIVR